MANDALPFGVGGPAENAVGAPQFVINALNAMGNVAAAPGRAYQSTEPVTSDQMVKPATDLASMVTLGAGAMPAEADALRMGIKAYHGSPHDFDRFDISKIGSGEGAQSYGHGLYFAENPEVAREYRDALSAARINFGGHKLLSPSDVRLALPNVPDEIRYPVEWSLGAMKRGASLEDALAGMRANYPNHPIGEAERILRENNPSINPTGKMYEVDINADPTHLLDWDRPLREQGEHVQNVLQNDLGLGLSPTDTGRDAYWQSMPAYRQREHEASQRLDYAGIPGIKYLDAGSRAAGEGSHNYVMFNDNLIKILKKYGIAGMPAGATALSGGPQDMIDALKGQGNAGQQ